MVQLKKKKMGVEIYCSYPWSLVEVLTRNPFKLLFRVKNKTVQLKKSVKFNKVWYHEANISELK